MRLDRRHAAVLLATLLGAAATLNPRMNSTLAKAPMAAPYAMTRRGPLTMAPCLLGLFAHSSAGVDRADLGWNVLAFSRAAFDVPFDDHPGLTMIFYDLRPGSRGRLRLRSADARQAPRILMNYLATARDRQVAAGGLRLTRRIMAAAALAGQQPVELSPGPAVRDDDEAAPQGAIAQRAGTIFHPVGTALMGPAGDAGAVVDARLQVHGLAGLYVVDASVMPSIISGNTASPIIMNAEKGAAMLLPP